MKLRLQIPTPPAAELEQLQRERIATGYTTIRVTRATAARIRELQALAFPAGEIRGQDAVLWFLVSHVLRRSPGVPATSPAEGSAAQDPGSPSSAPVPSPAAFPSHGGVQ